MRERSSIKAVAFATAILLGLCEVQGFSQEQSVAAIVKRPLTVQRANIPISKGEKLVMVLSSSHFIKERHEGGEYSILEVDSAGEKPIVSGMAPMRDFSYSKLSSRLCFWEDKDFVIVNLETGTISRITAIGTNKVRWFATISPPGTEILYFQENRNDLSSATVNDWSIIIRDLQTGSEREIAKGSMAKWSPGGNLIAFTRAEGVKGDWTFYIWVVKSDGTELRKLSSSKGMAGWPVSWSGDGKYLMELDAYGNLHIVNVAKDSATLIPATRFGADTKTYYREYLGASWVPGNKYIFAQVALTSKIQDEAVIGVESYLVSVDGTQITKLDLPKGASNFVFLNDSALVFRDKDGLWNKANIGGTEK